jgi:hypothetical protein
VIEEIELYDMDLFDLVVGALCKNEKKENPAGFNMMKVMRVHSRQLIHAHVSVYSLETALVLLLNTFDGFTDCDRQLRESLSTLLRATYTPGLRIDY